MKDWEPVAKKSATKPTVLLDLKKKTEELYAI